MTREEFASAVDRRIAMAAALLASSEPQASYPLLSSAIDDSALYQLSMALCHFVDESALVFLKPPVDWQHNSLDEVLDKADIAPLIELRQLKKEGAWVDILAGYSMKSLFTTPRVQPSLIASDYSKSIQPSDIIVFFRSFLSAQREFMVEY